MKTAAVKATKSTSKTTKKYFYSSFHMQLEIKHQNIH